MGGLAKYIIAFFKMRWRYAGDQTGVGDELLTFKNN